MNLVASLKGEIANLQDKINDIQSCCCHSNAEITKTFRSSFCNYTEFLCLDCDKEFIVFRDQE